MNALGPDTCRLRGAVLLLCLLLLLGLSLLGLAAASDRQVQEHINANVEAARQGETAARMGSLWARGWLWSLGGETPPPLCADSCPAGSVILAPGSLGAQPGSGDADWWHSQGHAAGFDPLSGEDSGWPGLPDGSEAYWLIEQLHMEPAESAEDGDSQLGWYRILSRGANIRPGSAFISESIVARPWGNAAWQRDLPPRPGDPHVCALVPEPLACGRQAWQDLP